MSVCLHIYVHTHSYTYVYLIYKLKALTVYAGHFCFLDIKLNYKIKPCSWFLILRKVKIKNLTLPFYNKFYSSLEFCILGCSCLFKKTIKEKEMWTETKEKEIWKRACGRAFQSPVSLSFNFFPTLFIMLWKIKLIWMWRLTDDL